MDYLVTTLQQVLEQIFPILDPCGSAAVNVLLRCVPGGGDSLVVVQGSLSILGDPSSHNVHVDKGEDEVGDCLNKVQMC